MSESSSPEFFLLYPFPFDFLQELEDPLILIHEKKISSLNAVVKVLELALKVLFYFASQIV